MSTPNAHHSSLPVAGSRCFICKNEGRREFRKDGYWIRTCRRCSHRYAEIQLDATHIGKVYTDDYFFGGGAGYSNYLSERALLTAHGRRYGEVLNRYIPSPGTVLDVGAASGFIMRGLQDCGWKPTGIEPNERLAGLARDEFGFTMHEGGLEEFDATKRFDLVTMIQVVPHFHHPHKAFERARNAVKGDGYWLIETWNWRSITAKIFGRHWHEYSPPTVLNWFSPRSLELLCSQFGMRVVAKGRPKKRLNGEHAKSLLHYRIGQGMIGKVVLPIASALIPNRLPIPYPAEDLFWMLLQTSD